MEPTAITHLERKIILPTSRIMFHVNLPGGKDDGVNLFVETCNFCEVPSSLGDLEEFLTRGCFEPTVVGQFHWWHLNIPKKRRENNGCLEGFGSVRFLWQQNAANAGFSHVFTGIHKISRWFCLMGSLEKSCSTTLYPGLIQDAFHLGQGATVSFGLPNGWYKSEGFQQQWGGETAKFIIFLKQIDINNMSYINMSSFKLISTAFKNMSCSDCFRFSVKKKSKNTYLQQSGPLPVIKVGS